MTSEEKMLRAISAEVWAFGLPQREYVDALRRLLDLDDAIKRRSATQYLDVILELLFRLQDTFAIPFLDPNTSDMIRDDALRLSNTIDDVAVRNAVNDVLNNLPQSS